MKKLGVVLLAVLCAPAAAWADGGRTSAGSHRHDAGHGAPTRVAAGDEDEDEDEDAAADPDDEADEETAPRPKKPKKAKKPVAADDEADDSSDDDEADDAADDGDRKRGWRRKPGARKPTADDDADSDSDSDSADDDSSAGDDAAAAADDDDDDDRPIRKKKVVRKKRPAKRKRVRKPAAEEAAAVDTGPQVIQERYIFPPKITVAGEVLGAKPMDSVNSDLFAAGGGAALGLEYFVSPALGIHVSAMFLYLRAGGGMSTTTWLGGQIGPRLHLGSKLFGAGTHHDAWLDAHANYGTSGGIRRPGFDVGAAVQWELSPALRLGPILRYSFGSDPLDKNAHLVTVGLAVGIGGRTRTTVHIEGDADGDGLIDRLDECATELPGDQPDEDHPGCPTRDGDADGVVDSEDECPEEAAGDVADPAHAGCPVRELDTDGDSVLDKDDKCPAEPGPSRPGTSNNGCPLARVQDQHIEIFEQIFFELDSATISDSSRPVLESLARVINELGASHISIEGHTDEVGTDAYNMDLSKRRARAVAQWLIDNGSIPATRLETKGFGKRRPLVSGKGADTSKNRRVEFVILEEK